AEEVIRFVNLHSVWRGSHRFPALLTMLRLLADRPEPAAAGVTLPDLSPLARFVESGSPLSEHHLQAVQLRTGSEIITRVLAWSADLSRRLQAQTEHLPPMAGARAALERMRGRADAAVVSQAPALQLAREWKQGQLETFVFAIAGSECGRKPDQIRALAGPRHSLEHTLVIGDAPGDLAAAREVGAHFFPIIPDREDESWTALLAGPLDDFLNGRYGGESERARIRAFETALPEIPPWAS
ncbi:MAG: hypothetical protein KBA51_06935, partial [Kiritimatiellae bacterium]|nr:hypothetical protein [Kiritimatiellia bacterium]